MAQTTRHGTPEGRACLWKASRSSLAGSSPTAPGFSKPLVHWISVPESSVWWSTGKLKPKPSTGRARSAMALRAAGAAPSQPRPVRQEMQTQSACARCLHAERNQQSAA